MNTVMSSQNVTTNTNIVMASTTKLRNVKPSLTNSIAILHVSDAQNARSLACSSFRAPQPSGAGGSPMLIPSEYYCFALLSLTNYTVFAPEITYAKRKSITDDR